MNDQNLKKLLQDDDSMPNRQINEWDKIETMIKLNSRPSINIFKNRVFLGLATVSTLMLLLLPNLFSGSKINLKEKENITLYLFEDDYFSDSYNSYNWIDNEI